MKYITALIASLLLTTGAMAQSGQVKTSSGTGAVLRVLDTLNGNVEDYELQANGEERKILGLYITLDECRYPEGNVARNAYAHMVIRDIRAAEPNFVGWMIASSPALSALEHPRYDVWVTKCITSDG